MINIECVNVYLFVIYNYEFVLIVDIYFVSESSQMSGAHGTALLRVSYRDCMQLVEKAVTQLGKLFYS